MKIKWISYAVFLTLILTFILSCSDNNKTRFFKNSLNDYIEAHPISLFYNIDSIGVRYKINCTYPFYEAYFTKDSQGVKTLKIQQKLYYTENTTDSNKLQKGIFYFKNKYPIIVYDMQNSSQNFIFDSLIKKIPDSLIYTYKKCDGQMMRNNNNKSKIYRMNPASI